MEGIQAEKLIFSTLTLGLNHMLEHALSLAFITLSILCFITAIGCAKIIERHKKQRAIKEAYRRVKWQRRAY